MSMQHRAGKGLGLHISRHLAGSIGSELELHSELGKGTEIVITLDNSSSVRNKHLQSVMVIGPTRHKTYGEWVPLLSSWKMPAMVAANLDEASTMIQVLNDAPEILILCASSVPTNIAAQKELSALLGRFGKQPLIYVDATSGSGQSGFGRGKFTFSGLYCKKQDGEYEQFNIENYLACRHGRSASVIATQCW